MALVAVSALTLAACQYSGSPAPVVTVTVPAPAPSSANLTAAGGTRFFAANSPWNTPVDTAAVDPHSATMLADAGERLGVNDDGVNDTDVTTTYRRAQTNLYINTTAWTVPVVSGGQPTSIVCRQTECGTSPRTMTLDVPANADPDPRYDGWFTIIDTKHDVAYDLWRARREPNGSISYQFDKTWALDGSGYSTPGTPSARGSGLPLFAGLITPAELQNGLIQHALAISVPGPSQKYFVSPASATDGNGPTAALPEGSRIRLKAGVVPAAPRDPTTGKLIPLTASQKRTADAIMSALRTYGAIVVDRAVVPTLYAESGVPGGLIAGNELQGLTLSDFEVVAQGKSYTYPLPTPAPPASPTPSTGVTQ